MFWKIVRWGGTVILVAVTAIALLAAKDNKNEEHAEPIPASSGSSFGS